jgi:hypothetical protein
MLGLYQRAMDDGRQFVARMRYRQTCQHSSKFGLWFCNHPQYGPYKSLADGRATNSRRKSMRIRHFFALLALLACACFAHAQDARLMVLDPQFYLDKYPDLKRAFGPNNLEAAKQHWLNNGIKEGRQSSFSFSLPAYQAKNSDLWDHNIRTYEAVLNHYVTLGYKENRDTSPRGTPFDMPLTFDPDFYQRYYSDIGRAMGGNFGAIVKHWRENGIKEGRLPNREALAEALKLGVDPEYYATRYPDLRNGFKTNAVALVTHYKDWGRNEGRYAIPGAETAFESGPASSGHGRQYLRKGDWLATDQYLRSASRAYIAVQQGDGNFCVYKVGSAQDPTYPGLSWCSRNTSAPAGQYYTVFQGDGNLCTYAGTGPSENKGFVTCPSGPRNGDFYLILQDDGNLVMYPGKNPASRTGNADWNVGYYKNPKGSISQWLVGAANVVGNGTVLAANSVANTAVLAAYAATYGLNVAANQTAQTTTQLANTVASATVLAAETVARTAVDVANQTASIANSVIDAMRANCSSYSRYFPDPLAGMQGVTMLAEVVNRAAPNVASSETLACVSEFRAAYYCQIPEELVNLVKDVKAIPDITRRAAEESIKDECQYSFALAGPPMFFMAAPLACGAMKLIVNDGDKMRRCISAAANKGLLWELTGTSAPSGSSVQSRACNLAGKVTAKIGKMVLTRQIPAGSTGKMLYDGFSRTGTSANLLQKLLELPECRD